MHTLQNWLKWMEEEEEKKWNWTKILFHAVAQWERLLKKQRKVFFFFFFHSLFLFNLAGLLLVLIVRCGGWCCVCYFIEHIINIISIILWSFFFFFLIKYFVFVPFSSFTFSAFNWCFAVLLIPRFPMHDQNSRWLCIHSLSRKPQQNARR